jgi:hypothetical protein
MILKGISEVTAYRMHVPKWAVAHRLAAPALEGMAVALTASV